MTPVMADVFPLFGSRRGWFRERPTLTPIGKTMQAVAKGAILSMFVRYHFLMLGVKEGKVGMNLAW